MGGRSPLLRTPLSRSDTASRTSIASTIQEHLKTYVQDDLDALVFTGQNGAVLRRSNFRRDAHWAQAVASLGREGLHFHDLRHTGNHLAAQGGASLRDLMDRMATTAYARP